MQTNGDRCTSQKSKLIDTKMSKISPVTLHSKSHISMQEQPEENREMFRRLTNVILDYATSQGLDRWKTNFAEGLESPYPTSWPRYNSNNHIIAEEIMI